MTQVSVLYDEASKTVLDLRGYVFAVRDHAPVLVKTSGDERPVLLLFRSLETLHAFMADARFAFDEAHAVHEPGPFLDSAYDQRIDVVIEPQRLADGGVMMRRIRMLTS